MPRGKSFGYEINSFQEMNTLFQMIVEETLEKVTKEVEEELTEYVMKKWYASYTPKQYYRTMEYINSITRIKANMAENGYIETEVFFDTDKIHPYIREKGELNAHASVSGADVSKRIPEWIENGNPSIIGRHDAASKEGIKTVEHLQEWVNKNINKKFKQELRKYGLTFYDL